MIANFQFDTKTHTFTRGENIVPSVTWILARAGICDFSFVNEEIRLRAMHRGKSVHWMLQLEDEGLLNYRRVPAALRGYRRAYQRWKQASGFVVLSVEKQFMSKLGYAGIIDRVGSFPHAPSRVVLDFKTGGIQDCVRYQLCAYAVGIQPNISLARTIRRIGLSLLPDGDYKVKEFPLSSFDSDISRFIEALKGVQNARSS